MIAPGRVFAVTLAAGLARRFGSDKLSQPLEGGGTVLDAAMAPLAQFRWLDQGVVIQQDRAQSWQGPAEPIVNPAPAQGMGHSLALAANAAAKTDADYLLVTLGDMPLLTAESIGRLLDACPAADNALACLVPKGRPAGPPAIFGRGWFAALGQADGDNGARAILRDPANSIIRVPLPADQAIDIDVPTDLSRLAQG